MRANNSGASGYVNFCGTEAPKTKPTQDGGIFKVAADFKLGRDGDDSSVTIKGELNNDGLEATSTMEWKKTDKGEDLLEITVFGESKPMSIEDLSRGPVMRAAVTVPFELKIDLEAPGVGDAYKVRIINAAGKEIASATVFGLQPCFPFGR